jgi:hypothetical protein
MSDTERMNPLLAFPFNSFLKLRLEFALLTGDVMQALLLRIIENRVDAQRKKLYQARLNAIGRTVPDDVILDIPTDIWVPISHAAFLYELYGLIKTEATLRKVLTALCDKQLIFTRKGTGRYDPTEYQLNRERITTELTRMRARGKAGYQPLPPSEGDTPMVPAGYQPLIPSEGQPLTPSSVLRVSGSDPLRVSAVDTSNRKMTEEQLREVAAEESETGSGGNSTPNAAATADSTLDVGTLTPEEIALIQAYRQQHQYTTHLDTHESEPPVEASDPALTGPSAAQIADEPIGSSPCPDATDTPSTQSHPEDARTDEASSLLVQSGETENRPSARSSNLLGVVPGSDAAIITAVAVSTCIKVPPTEQAVSVQASEASAPVSQQASFPEPVLTPDAVVALFEYKRGTPYDAVTRQRQLAAAYALLDLALPLDLVKLERVYDAYHDVWWIQHYGDLHVSHLVEREKSGEICIVRWLARMAPPSRTRKTRATVTPTPEQMAGLRPHIGVSGLPIFQPSKTPMKVVPPQRPVRRPAMSRAFAGMGG